MLKKFFLGLMALFFVLLGSLILLMGYVFNNPQSVFTAFNTVTDKFFQGQKYEEKEEFFIQGMDTLSFTSRHTDMKVKTYSGSTIKVLLQGRIPRFEQGPYILQTAEGSQLHIDFQEPLASQWIQMNINGQEVTQESDAKLIAEIYIPESFKKQIHIQSKSGSVSLALPEEKAYELDLQSVSGKIENLLKQKPTSDIQSHEVGHIQIQTEQGSIKVEAQ